MRKHYLILTLLIFVFLSLLSCKISVGQNKEYKITLWYGTQQIFGNSGFQQPMINIIGQVSDFEELHTLSYRFQGIRKPIPIGPTAFRLAEPGDFNIEIDRTQLLPGLYNLGIIAVYKNGIVSREQLSFKLENETAKFPLEIDWSSTSKIQDVAQVVDGKWDITKDGVRTLNIGYDRAIVIGDSSWTDYEVNLEFIIHSFSDDSLMFGWPSMGAAMHVALRWQGHLDWNDLYPRRGWTGFGALFSYNYQMDKQEKLIWIYDQQKEKSIKTAVPCILETGKSYRLKSQVNSRPGNTSVYRMKLWETGELEPQDWEIEVEGHKGEPEKGSILMIAHQADISFKNIIVKNLNQN